MLKFDKNNKNVPNHQLLNCTTKNKINQRYIAFNPKKNINTKNSIG